MLHENGSADPRMCPRISAPGMNNKDAGIADRSLVEADMRGISSHGVTRLPTYSKRLSTKVIDPQSSIQIQTETSSTLHVNGRNGMGSVVGTEVMNLCMKKADDAGSCFAAVNNGNHFGIGSFFALPAAKKGYIALAMSNAPASVVPFGGAEKKIGTDPLSIAVPAGDGMPFVVDMATSVVAQGKIIQAGKEGEAVPSGWEVDKDGNDTTDPEAALSGAMLPFGGPKGYAIGLLVQILCSAVAGGNLDNAIPSFWNNFDDPQNLGHFFGVIKIDSLVAFDTFNGRMDVVKQHIKSTKPAKGYSEVFLPGEIEYNRENKSLADGVELSETIMNDIVLCGKENGVDSSILFSG